MVGGPFLATSLRDIANRREGGEPVLDDLLAEMETAFARSEPLRIWRDFDLGDLRERCRKSFTPPPYATLRVPDVWDMPFAAKDIFNSTKFSAEKGSDQWRGYRAGNDARAIDYAEKRGAVLVGMASTSEFAVDLESPTLNPHAPDRTPGTSSAGSAVAAALGLVAFALGTQSAGSIVRPASFSGTIGMKPSFGLIPRTGVLKTSDSLDTVGFFVPRVDSLRPVLTALRVHGRDYPFVYRKVDPDTDVEISVSDLRIGLVRTPFWSDCQDDVLSLLDDLVGRTGAATGAVKEVVVDDAIARAHALHDTIYNASLAYHLSEDFEASSATFSNVLRERLLSGSRVTSSEYGEALREQARISEALTTAFSAHDALITVGTTTPAPLRGAEPQRDPSLIWTLAGLPAVSVPLGFSREGLPVGVQFVAAKYKDYRLVSALESLARMGVIHESSLPVGPNGEQGD